MSWVNDIGHALFQNVKVSIGGQKMNCECSDSKCAYNSHKVELKRKYLSSVCANDVDLYDSDEFYLIKTSWFDGEKCFSRSKEDQKEYDITQEEMLKKLGYKSMDIKGLRKLYDTLNKTNTIQN